MKNFKNEITVGKNQKLISIKRNFTLKQNKTFFTNYK